MSNLVGLLLLGMIFNNCKEGKKWISYAIFGSLVIISSLFVVTQISNSKSKKKKKSNLRDVFV